MSKEELFWVMFIIIAPTILSLINSISNMVNKAKSPISVLTNNITELTNSIKLIVEENKAQTERILVLEKRKEIDRDALSTLNENIIKLNATLEQLVENNKRQDIRLDKHGRQLDDHDRRLTIAEKDILGILTKE